MSTLNTKTKSIQCPSCGQAIDLFGGHNVQEVVCKACKAILDPKKDFAEVAKFVYKKNRPRLPLKPGMSGKIKGVEFTVTGIIKWRERDEGRYYYSYEFPLFSPTHGYAWLGREDGHYTFVREVKDLPDPYNVPGIKGRKFVARDKTFRVHETGVETVDYVEGELTYVLKTGDKQKYLIAACPPYMYEISESQHEKTFAFGEYITKEEVYKAFGIKGKPIKPRKAYFCQEYKQSTLLKVLNMAKWFAIISLLLAVLIPSRGKQITSFTWKGEPLEHKINIEKPGGLMAFDIYSPVDQAWAWCNIRVIKDDKEYFSLQKEISYYHGSDWSEGSQNVRAYFKLPEKGEYIIVVEGDKDPKAVAQIVIRVKKDIVVSRYFIISTIILVLLGGAALLHRGVFIAQQRDIEVEN